jgi:hypothetical protein
MSETLQSIGITGTRPVMTEKLNLENDPGSSLRFVRNDIRCNEKGAFRPLSKFSSRRS